MFDRLIAHCTRDGDCWTWIGPTRRHGGGDRPAISMRVPNKPSPVNRNAARIMCEVFHGPPPTPQHEASHLCGSDNWLCVHPWHLIWETRSENMKRMYADRRREVLEHHDFDPELNAGSTADACPF